MAKRLVAALLALSLCVGSAGAADMSTRCGGTIAGGTAGAVLGWGSGLILPALALSIPGVVVIAAVGAGFGFLMADRD